MTKELPEFVVDATNLEGCNFTIPEIQTLLQNVTVGGKSLTDTVIAQNQCNAWNKMINDLTKGVAEVSPEYMLELHRVVAKEEALEWGEFRQSQVYIAGTEYTPPEYEDIPLLVSELFESLASIEDIDRRATHLFLQIARLQPFYDIWEPPGCS